MDAVCGTREASSEIDQSIITSSFLNISSFNLHYSDGNDQANNYVQVIFKYVDIVSFLLSAQCVLHFSE